MHCRHMLRSMYHYRINVEISQDGRPKKARGRRRDDEHDKIGPFANCAHSLLQALGCEVMERENSFHSSLNALSDRVKKVQ